MTTPSSMNLSQLIKLSQKLQGPINPVTHLEMLLQSHNFKDYSEDASEFFYYMSNNPEFFHPDKMPAKWSLRTLSAAMESLRTILQADTIKSELIQDMGQDDYDGVLAIIETKRKWYMNEAKKEQRKMASNKKETETTSEESVPLVATTPLEAKLPDLAKQHIAQAMWILDRFMESEKDEFKVILLELMQKELVVAMSHLNKE